MAGNISMYWLNNSNASTTITLGTTNPLPKSNTNSIAQPLNWYYGYTKVQNEYIMITINVSGWYSWLLTGPPGLGGANASSGSGFGGGGGAGSATAQTTYFAAGTVLCGILYNPGPQPSVLMLINNTTHNCSVNGYNYSIIPNTYSGIYNAQYNGNSYPANTAVQDEQYSTGVQASGDAGGNGGNGGSQDYNTTTGSTFSPNTLNTYSWIVSSYPLTYEGYPNNVFQYGIQSSIPTSYGGAGGNGGNDGGTNSNYNGQAGFSCTPATNSGVGGSNANNVGYVNYTCNDGMSVIINKGGYQNEASDSPFLMFYYYSE